MSSNTAPENVEQTMAQSGNKYHGTLIARGLTKSYKSRRVVDGVSIGVRRGEALRHGATPRGIREMGSRVGENQV